MLRTNLSTRPFYNERLVRVVLGAVALAALGLGIFDAAQIVRLRTRSADVRQQAEAAEREAAGLRGEARAIRQSLNRDQLETVQVAAREANLLIDRRAFSWTDLFNRFEATLPADVRISAVQPQVDTDGRMLVAISAVARRIEDVDAFTEALQTSGSFSSALARQVEAQDDGTLRVVVQGYYVFPSAVAAPPEAEATPGEAPPAAQARAEEPR